MKKTQLEDFLLLSSEGIKTLSQGINYADFIKSETLIHKGQQVAGAYFVISGQLRVFTYTPSGQEVTLYFIRPGETCVLALNCLFNDLRYPAWVDCVPETNIAIIPGQLYKALFSFEKEIQNLTVKGLSTLVFRLMNELEQIHSWDLTQRLADFLLNHANTAGEVSMTQQELAAHLGTTREVIARLMQRFSAKGFVSTRRGSVSLLKPTHLAALLTPN